MTELGALVMFCDMQSGECGLHCGVKIYRQVCEVILSVAKVNCMMRGGGDLGSSSDVQSVECIGIDGSHG